MAPRLLHLRTTVANRRPDPALMADGQFAQNQSIESPATFFKDVAGGLVKVGPTHIGPTAPNAIPAGFAGNSKGESWLDISAASPLLKFWDGVQWLVGGGGAGGDLWIDGGSASSNFGAAPALIDGGAAA